MTLQQTIAEYLKYTGHKGLDISAALIDCDGVLYDSMKYHTQAWVKLMKKNGIKCTRDEFYELEGMTGSEIIKMKFKKGAGKNITDDEAHALYGVKTRYFNELGEAPVMPGAVRVLEALKEAGVERILVTGSQQDTILERIEKDFPNLFGEVKITGHDVRKGKPNPEPYLKAMAKAAHAAGCFTIGVTTGPIPEKDLYKAGADLVYKNMDELAAALPSLLVALTIVKA